MDVATAFEELAKEVEAEARAKAKKLRALAAQFREENPVATHPPAPLDAKLSDLGFRPPTLKILHDYEGFETVADLIHYPDDYFLRIVNFGHSRLKEMRDKVGPAQPPLWHYGKPTRETPEGRYWDVSGMDAWSKQPSETEQQYNDRLASLAAAMADEDGEATQG